MMQLAKFIASTQKLKKAGLYRIGARKNQLIKVRKFINCTVFFGSNEFVVIPENLIYFLSAEEIQDLKEGKTKLKNGKVV